MRITPGPGNRGPRRANPLVTAVVLLAVILVAAACGQPAAARPIPRTAPVHPVVRIKPIPTVAVTKLGPSGVVSSAVVDENQQPGTAAWRITDQGAGSIDGFADLNYAAVGNIVHLFVSTTAPTFTVTAYRMGWYQGLGAREIWASAPIAGTVQPPCPVTPVTNMVSCANWTPDVTMPVTPAFVPGDYLLKLVGSGNQQAYVLLTVWDPSSHATYLIMNRSLVEQGWNTFDGYSFYAGVGPCILDSNTYPVCDRARVVSFDRPYAGDGSSDFLTNEYPLVAYAEELGLDVTYCTDICISEHPTFVLQHRALLGLDHDETWTNSERLAVIDAFDAGVNVAFLGAATLVRHARLQPSALGPDREEVDYRNGAEDPLDGKIDPKEVTGNTWASPPTDWVASAFLGQLYSGYLQSGQPSVAMKVFDASAWIFKGTGLADGDLIPGVINSDIDHVDPGGPKPADLQVLAHSPIPLSEAFTDEGKWNGFTYSDMTYYTSATSHAGLFDSGDNVWVATLVRCPATDPTCPSSYTRRITGNLLWLFGQGPAGSKVPSTANWTTVTPPGS